MSPFWRTLLQLELKSFSINDHSTGCSDFPFRYLLDGKDQRDTKMADGLQRKEASSSVQGRPTAGGNEDSQRGLVS